MNHQGWTATGVIEASPDRVRDVFLAVRPGPVGDGNAPLLRALPGAGRFMGGANLSGGPHEFTVYYGTHPGGTVEWIRTTAGSPSKAGTNSAPNIDSHHTRKERF